MQAFSGSAAMTPTFSRGVLLSFGQAAAQAEDLSHCSKTLYGRCYSIFSTAATWRSPDDSLEESHEIRPAIAPRNAAFNRPSEGFWLHIRPRKLLSIANHVRRSVIMPAGSGSPPIA
jgi:hypothetical protein